jgi:1-acyl-sn-glycerol-3-phosphate acyltransferase
MDMFVIGYKLKRKIRWMAKEELFKNPLLGALLRFLGAFSVKRGKVDINSVKTAYKLIENGHIVGIFPEAHRMRGKERYNVKVKHGAAMIAVNTGAPLVPVAVDGSYKIFSRIRVIIGKPFYLNSDENIKNSKEQLNDMSMSIMKKVYMLLEES